MRIDRPATDVIRFAESRSSALILAGVLLIVILQIDEVIDEIRRFAHVTGIRPRPEPPPGLWPRNEEE